jgi:hypothetical protein
MVSSRSALLILASGLLAFGAAVAGCADPEGEFDAFTERYANIGSTTTTTGTGGASACALPEPGAVDGDYFMTLSAKISPTKPIVFLAKLTTTAMGEGLGLSMNLQALSYMDRMTLVGEAADVGPFQVEADGRFVAAMGPMTVVGEANPITMAEVVADATLTGTICTPGDFICGDVAGTVDNGTLELKLDGSTFTMQKIPESGVYPEAVLNCAGDTAPLQ